MLRTAVTAAAVVVVATGMRKDGDRHEGEEEASCGPCRRRLGLREGCHLPRWGLLEGDTEPPKVGAGCFTSLVPFLLLALDSPLFPLKAHPLDPSHG